MNLFYVEQSLCLSNLLMEWNDIGFLIFAGPLNLTRYLIIGFQKKCQNYHQNHYHVLHYLCDLFLQEDNFFSQTVCPNIAYLKNIFP